MTPEEIAAEEAAKTLKKELDEFDGILPVRKEEVPAAKPEVTPAKTDVSGSGEPVIPKAAEGEDVVKLKAEMLRLQTELHNSKGMAHEEREKRKKSTERIDALEKQIKVLQTAPHPLGEGEEGQPKEIAPEDRELIRKAAPELDKFNEVLPEMEQIITDGRINRFKQSEENAVKKYGKDLYTQAVKTFEDEIAGDETVFAEFKRSKDPADFIVRKVIERDPLKYINKPVQALPSAEEIEKAKKEGIEEGKKAILEELRNKGTLPASLSSIGGSPSVAQGDSLQKELQSF